MFVHAQTWEPNAGPGQHSYKGLPPTRSRRPLDILPLTCFNLLPAMEVDGDLVNISLPTPSCALGLFNGVLVLNISGCIQARPFSPMAAKDCWLQKAFPQPVFYINPDPIRGGREHPAVLVADYSLRSGILWPQEASQNPSENP